MKYRSLILTLFATALAAAIIGSCSSSSKPTLAASPDAPAAAAATPTRTVTNTDFHYSDGDFDGNEIVKTDAEWKKQLTPAQYQIMREAGTDEPYMKGGLDTNHKTGTYYCAACGMALFTSQAKFESGTGWPSFFEPISKKNVIEKEDRSLPGEPRTEIECARCHAHLGHVFDDGPQPTGLRYCMNSTALKFKAAS